MSVHVVSDIDVKDFGSEFIKIGDLNGDGAPDILFVQSVYETRQITCLTATTIHGERLWQVGVASADQGRIYSDLPVQIYDWDGDGENEVLYVEQAEYVDPLLTGRARERAKTYVGNAIMLVLDAATGVEKKRFAIPAAADDCFLFADLTGRGRRQDLIVKDRYWNMWGISHTGEVLWHWRGSTGHCPAIADIDGDGRDEVFVGFALIDHDGKELFLKKTIEHEHQDAATITRCIDGRWLLAFGNSGVHCLTPEGRLLWHHPLAEAQHVVAAKFRKDSEIQFMVLNRGSPRHDQGRDPATLYLYDLNGREIWRQVQPQGSWGAAIREINWNGDNAMRQLLVYGRGPDNPIAIYDGDAEIIDVLSVPQSTTGFYCTRADVWGDGRDEVIIFSSRSARICANCRPLAIATHYNQTLYPGM